MHLEHPTVHFTHFKRALLYTYPSLQPVALQVVEVAQERQLSIHASHLLVFNQVPTLQAVQVAAAALQVLQLVEHLRQFPADK